MMYRYEWVNYFCLYPINRVPLACRAYIKTAGLRSTIAWAMASLAEIKVRNLFWSLLIEYQGPFHN